MIVHDARTELDCVSLNVDVAGARARADRNARSAPCVSSISVSDCDCEAVGALRAVREEPAAGLDEREQVLLAARVRRQDRQRARRERRRVAAQRAAEDVPERCRPVDAEQLDHLRTAAARRRVADRDAAAAVGGVGGSQKRT
jgi:hypothetical protein